MLVTTRRAQTEDVPLLVRLYSTAYRDGYSASFDRYGPPAPRDFWWVQSEKEVLLLEINRAARGLVIIGRRDGALVVEEMLGDFVQTTSGSSRDGALAKADQTVLQRIGTLLLQRFARERQPRFLLRTAESNALGLLLARQMELTFAGNLTVAVARPRRQTPHPPEGYAVRRPVAADVPELLRIYAECFATAPSGEEVAALLRRAEMRAAVGEREGYMAGFMLGQAREGGFGDVIVGVREAHRRRGLGRALAVPAQNFFASRGIPALGLYWGVDGLAGAYYRGLGFATERVYLFFEKTL